MYNLLYFQVIVKLCSSLTEAECNQIILKYGTEEFSGFNNLGSAMAYVLKVTNKCQQFRNDPSFATSTNNLSGTFASTSTSSQPEINLNLIEQQLQKLCLPFLRIAALLRHHLYEQHLPEIKVPQMEFVCLVYFLELVTVDINWDSFDAAKALCFVPGHEQKLPELWCVQLMSQHRGLIFEEIANKEMATLVNDQHALWEQPRLLRLPREYEKLFTVSSWNTTQMWWHWNNIYFLLCSTIMKKCVQIAITSRGNVRSVYFVERLFVWSNVVVWRIVALKLFGYVLRIKSIFFFISWSIRQEFRNSSQLFSYELQHSMRCGGGTGIFLVVPSTYIIVVRGRRACLWGSLYLDDYFEEDRDLR